MGQMQKPTKEELEESLSVIKAQIETLKSEILKREKEINIQYKNFYEITDKIYNKDYVTPTNKGADLL